MANVNKIQIEYENGIEKTLKRGIAVEFDNENMSIDMVNVSKLDLVRLAYGLVAAVEQAGMKDLLLAYMSGESLPDEGEVQNG